MANNILDKVKVWKMADGSIRYTLFMKNAIHDGIDEDSFIESESMRLRESDPLFRQATEFIMNVSDLPVGDTSKWRMDSNNKLFIDNTVETEAEKDDKSEVSIKDKLSKLGFNNSEIELILR